MSTENTFDLKATINLPKTNFAQKANLTEREPARLEKWQAMNLYEEICRARAGRQMFILHDGPPYANSDIHLGTAMNKIIKDLIVKSHAMLGFDAPYVPGYDCHGLPIEKHVEKALDEKKIKKHELSPLEFRKICREHAAEALKRQTRDFKRLGILGEWDNPYMTMSNAYEAETARLFGDFVRHGYVYNAFRPVQWCITDQTALAEAEVEYKEHTSPSIYVKFPLPADQVAILERRIADSRQPTAGSEEGESAIRSRLEPLPQSAFAKPVFVLIWTTTPWTLPANLGICFHPRFEYSAIDVGEEIYILASDLVESVKEKCGLGDYSIVAKFPGEVIDGLYARHAWIDRPSLLMLGEHVTLGGNEFGEDEAEVQKSGGKAGTGCVHTAPGHGMEDYLIGQEYREQLEPIYAGLSKLGALEGQPAGKEVYCPVDFAGRFTKEVEHFAGQKVFAANKEIVEFMRNQGALLYAEDYNHRYAHCWRCKRPLIFRATPQWFISMDKAKAGDVSLRESALREIEKVNWIPAWGRGRMHNMFTNRPDWCVSRQRLWGVPIPAFYCEGCNEAVLDAEVIDHVSAIFEQETADAWYAREAEYLLPDGFKCPKCASTRFKKDMDILDVWFDSGSSSLAVLERERHLPWPADVYMEGPDQYRGWFNSSLMVALAAHGQAPYKTVITHGWTVDGQGKAMHKSAGNAISPNEVADSQGAEILRLWVASADFTEDVRLSKEILTRLVETYRKIRNTARYALGNIYDFNPETDLVGYEELFEIDRWALAATNEVARKVVDAYKRFDYTAVYHAIYNYTTVTLSAVYFDILKDRLYTYAPKSPGRRSAQTALYKIIEAYAKLLAPVLVFTADEIWENIPGAREASVHIAEFPKAESRADEKALFETWDKIFEVRSSVQKALEEKRNDKVIGSSLEAKVKVKAAGATLELLKRYEQELAAIFIVSEVVLEAVAGDTVEVEVAHADGAKCERCWNWSVTVGENRKYPMLDARCVRQVEEGWGSL
ncbi:MAG: isoleucine--tRNA ligase [Acidobacteriota bacterium]